MSTVHIPLLAMNPSGGIRMVVALANGLAARGVGVRIVVPDYACDPPAALAGDIRLEVVTPHRGSKLDYMRRLIADISGATGVVVSTGYLTPALIFAAAPEARMFSLIQGVETESHIRYGQRPGWMKPGLRALARFGYRVPGYKVAVSQFVADRVGRRFVDEVINPGIRAEFIEWIPDDGAVRDRSDRLVVGVLPAPGEAKGVSYAIDALASLVAEGESIAPVVYDGNYPVDHIPAAVARYGAVAGDGKLNLASFYRYCDVFVLPSLYEGFALPPLEAMACGTAVITTDCGGTRDYAVEGGNALVVPPGSAGAIAAAVTRLNNDETLRRHLIGEGYHTAARLPEARFVQRCTESVIRVLRG